MRQSEPGGMYPEEIKAGTTIHGRRVAAMSRGVANGQRTVTVRFEMTDRKGRKRLSEPVTYTLGTLIRVPGTRRATTSAMPAGPVERKPGGKLHGGWYGDADDNGSQGRADRHSRMINSLTYA